MSANAPTQPPSRVPLLTIALYVLAAAAALAGVLLLMSILGFAHSMEAQSFLLRVAVGLPLADLLVGALRSGTQTVAVTIFAVMLAIASLLYVAGVLVARAADLSERVRRLEQRLAELHGQPLR
jgi:hypothetical protein